MNLKGLDHYDRLVDALLEAGIDPWITLYHWDLPQALQERGGWPNRDLADWFTDYAVTVTERLGDRVKHGMTMNEPWVCSYMGYRDVRRQDYLKTHLESVHRAIKNGAPLTGYLAGSFMDNYEWARGYRPRFGLVHNDYATQTRSIKDSGRMFAEIISLNGWNVRK